MIDKILSTIGRGTLYIVIEGPDKSGKSTVVKLLSQMFNDHCTATIYRQPELIRTLLMSDNHLSDYQKSLLFLADHQAGLEAHRDSDIIIGDRTALVSTLVYQWPNMELNEIQMCANIGTPMEKPTMVFILDGPKRAEMDDTPYERLNEYEVIRDRYVKVGKDLYNGVVVQTEEKTPEEIANEILGLIVKQFEKSLNLINW